MSFITRQYISAGALVSESAFWRTANTIYIHKLVARQPTTNYKFSTVAKSDDKTWLQHEQVTEMHGHAFKMCITTNM